MKRRFPALLVAPVSIVASMLTGAAPARRTIRLQCSIAASKRW